MDIDNRIARAIEPLNHGSLLNGHSYYFHGTHPLTYLRFLTHTHFHLIRNQSSVVFPKSSTLDSFRGKGVDTPDDAGLDGSGRENVTYSEGAEAVDTESQSGCSALVSTQRTASILIDCLLLLRRVPRLQVYLTIGVRISIIKSVFSFSQLPAITRSITPPHVVHTLHTYFKTHLTSGI